MGLFSKKVESYLGIDIGAHGIKFVELRNTKNRPQLWTYGIVRQELDIHIGGKEKHIGELIEEKTGINPKDIQAKKQQKGPVMDDARIELYAKLLKQLVKQSKAQTIRATSSLPVSQVFHTVINFPKISKKKIQELVNAEIAKLLPRPIDEMQIVHQEIPLEGEAAKKYTRLLVTAAPKTLVAFYTSIFQRAGLQLEELETEAFALSRSLVGKDNSVSMIVDMGAERTNFFIVDNGLPMTHRSIQIGGRTIDEMLAYNLGIQVDAVSDLKKDLSRTQPNALHPEVFSKVLEPIAKEIKYNFDLYLKQSGNQNKKPEKIILTGGTSLFPPVSEYLKKQFSLRIFVGDPWARVIHQDSLKPVLDEIGPRMSVAIGLALRNFKS